MGSDQPGQQISLQFTQLLEDDRFGEIQIYKSQDGKIVMKNSRTFVANDKRHQDFLRQLQCQQQSKDIRAVIPLLYHRRQLNKNLCIDYEITQLYSEYFNFTIDDLIRSNKDVDESELWLCLLQLTKLAFELQNKGFCMKLDVDQIFITLKGLPAIYPIFMNVQDCKSSTSESQQESVRCPMLKDIAQCVLKLGLMQICIVNTMLEKMSRKSRRLAIVLRDMIMNDSLRYSDVLQTIEDFSANEHIIIANQIKLNKFRYVIPTTYEQVRDTNFNQQSTGRTIKDLRPNRTNRYNLLKSSTKRQSEVQEDTVSQQSSKVSVALRDRTSAFSELENKKLMFMEQKERLEQRKLMMRGNNSSVAKAGVKDKNVHGSLKSSKMSNKGTSWTKKVITSQFDKFDSIDHLKSLQSKFQSNNPKRR